MICSDLILYVFLWLFARLFVTFRFARTYSRSTIKTKKLIFVLYCPRLFVTFTLVKVGCISGNTKKNEFSFGISLDFH